MPQLLFFDKSSIFAATKNRQNIHYEKAYTRDDGRNSTKDGFGCNGERNEAHR